MSDEDISDLSVDGVSLKNRDANIILKKHKNNVRNMVDNLYSLPIISKPIADVLMRIYQNEIKLFDVEIDMKINHKFYFSNILNVIDCINLEKSIYTLFTPNALMLIEINLF